MALKNEYSRLTNLQYKLESIEDKKLQDLQGLQYFPLKSN
jgi:hypothetical protein